MPEDMLTRGQVAKRLGKSVATVRRMEGSKLHPTLSERGVRYFEESEVDRVAAEVAETGRALPQGSSDSLAADIAEDDLQNLYDELDEVREQLNAAELRARQARDERDQATARADEAEHRLKMRTADVDKYVGGILEAYNLLQEQAEPSEITMLLAQHVDECVTKLSE